MSQRPSSSSDEEANLARDAPAHSTGPTTIPPTPDVAPESQASSRGRTPARTALRSSRCRGQSSPPPARLPSSSPASSYCSAVPTIPPIGKWTVAGLKQALGDSDIQASRKMNKAELYDLYVSLQSTPKTTHRQSKARRAQKSPAQSPPSSSRTGSGSLRPSRRSNRPSASLGRAPDSAMALPPLNEAQPSTTASAATAPHTAGPSGLLTPTQFYTPAVYNPFPFQRPPAPVADTSARLSPLAAQVQLLQQSHPTGYNPAHFQWPAAPVAQTSTSPPPLAAQAHFSSHNPSIPSYPPTNFPFQATAGHQSVRPPPTCADLAYSLPSSMLQLKSPHSLFTATPMPVPSNAVAMEPPPISQNIRAQILSGADVDLSSLLSLLPAAEPDRQIDCGDFSVTLKNPNTHSSRVLSFSEFSIAFSRYTEIICSAFPHRRRKLNDYQAIIAELALSYGGGHFFTYHKLFSAKSAVRVAQWNQCTYWGALDQDLHSRVFLGCKNISCAICRSVAHTTASCPQVNPSSLPYPGTSTSKSTSYVPRAATTSANQDSAFDESRHPCNHFNAGKCNRSRCRFMHICSFCGGAHARIICPVYKSVNKKSKNYLATPVNISRMHFELAHHPDVEFTHYLLSGLKNGFKPGLECPLSQNITCNNLQSALIEPEVVKQTDQKRSGVRLHDWPI